LLLPPMGDGEGAGALRIGIAAVGCCDGMRACAGASDDPFARGRSSRSCGSIGDCGEALTCAPGAGCASASEAPQNLQNCALVSATPRQRLHVRAMTPSGAPPPPTPSTRIGAIALAGCGIAPPPPITAAGAGGSGDRDGIGDAAAGDAAGAEATLLSAICIGSSVLPQEVQ